MNDSIRSLESLELRWPGFFDCVRAMNGHPVDDFTAADFMRVQARMLVDDEGMAIFTLAATELLRGGETDPAVHAWLVENGFLSKELTDLEAELEVLTERVALVTGEERRQDILRLREIHARTKALAARSRARASLAGADPPEEEYEM